MNLNRLNKVTSALCNMPMVTDRRCAIHFQWDIMEAESQAYFLEIHMKEIHTVQKDDGLWHVRIQHNNDSCAWYQGHHVNRKVAIAQAINNYIELMHPQEAELNSDWDDVDSYGLSA